jgi:hypothetical protein
MDYIRREMYLNKLIARRNNGEVKVESGILIRLRNIIP